MFFISGALDSIIVTTKDGKFPLNQLAQISQHSAQLLVVNMSSFPEVSRFLVPFPLADPNLPGTPWVWKMLLFPLWLPARLWLPGQLASLPLRLLTVAPTVSSSGAEILFLASTLRYHCISDE